MADEPEEEISTSNCVNNAPTYGIFNLPSQVTIVASGQWAEGSGPLVIYSRLDIGYVSFLTTYRISFNRPVQFVALFAAGQPANGSSAITKRRKRRDQRMQGTMM